MKFNKSAIAICVSSALLATTVIAQVQSETRVSFGQTAEAKSQFTIYLDGHAALDNHVQGKTNYKNEAASVIAKQDALFKQILILDPSATLINRSRLLSNFITISMSSSEAEDVASLESVQAVVKAPQAETRRMTKVANYQLTAEGDEEESAPVELMQPLTGNINAGEGVDVAIISTGIDYTSSFFGGSGVYGEDNDPETPPAAGSYLEALENGAVGPTKAAVEDDPDTEEDESADAIPGFDGFPTAVVAGGWDFNAENYGNDPNPIDQNHIGAHYSGWEYPTGLGTEIASIVHQLAPGAKLHAYKVSNISPRSWDPSSFDIRPSRQNLVIQAIEHALDPNQDGDTSDHLDIALLDAQGAAAFYSPMARGGAAGSSIAQLVVQKAAAQGLVIVTHAGYGGHSSTFGNETESNHRGWTALEAAATSAITVGSVIATEDGEGVQAAQWSPMGPVRGSKALKPEIVAMADDIPVSKISNADPEAATTDLRTDALSAAARIAAAAAVIKSAHPSFGPVEIKALLANTASNPEIKEWESDELAELLLIGHGLTDIDAAVSSPIVVWEKVSYQPYIQFGAHEVGANKRVIKNVTLRNISDSAQTYSLAYSANGTKDAHAALTVNFPATVNVPANSSVDIAVEVLIDGALLPEWPLQSTEDYTEANKKATELNGLLTFISAGNPEINVGWMLKARNETTIAKEPVGIEWPIYMGWNAEIGGTEYGELAFGESFYPKVPSAWGGPDTITYLATTASFVNESLTPTTFEAYPLLVLKDSMPEDKKELDGHMIHAVGGGIYDDARCEVTGKKLAIAVNFFNPSQLAMANYTDKNGVSLFYYDLFHEQIVKDNGWDESFAGVGWMDDSQIVNQPFVQLNENGQPATYYIDFNMTHDWSQPNARYTESKLPARFSNDGTNVVSEICLEELYHHDLDSVEDFDQNFGFHLETDRDAASPKNAPMIQFNPIKGGYYSEEEVCYDDGSGGGGIGIGPFSANDNTTAEFCETVATDNTVHVGFTETSAENPLETADFNHVYTAAPGEEVTIAATQLGVFGYWRGPFMVLSTSDDFFSHGKVGFTDADGTAIADVRAGQTFAVDENSAVGTVVGEIKLDTQGFFAVGDSSYQPHDLTIKNSLPGTPFGIDQETLELIVINPDALDYEHTKQLDVEVVATNGNTIGKPQVVSVLINDVNDVAPEVVAEVAAAVPAINVEIDKSEGTSFALDVSGLFVESEGQALTYTASAPGIDELSFDGKTLSGRMMTEGSYVVTVTASDGVNETSTDFTVNGELEESSSGGSMGGILAALAGLLMFRRRK